MAEGSVSTGSTSTSLLARVRQRDPVAWQRLANLYAPLVYYWARGAGLQPADALDVVQEVFRAILTSLDNFRRESPTDSFRGWLRGITRNKLKDHFRRLASRPEAAGGSDAQLLLREIADAPSAEDSAHIASDGAGLICRLLRMIEVDFVESTWQAFWRTAVDGRPPEDVARELGLSLAAVYKAKSRVLCRLRQELESLDDT